MNPLGGDEDVFGIGSVRDKILGHYEASLQIKGSNYNGIDECDAAGVEHLWPLMLFLTPPTSPDHSPIQEDKRTDEKNVQVFANLKENLTDDDDEVFKHRCTKDLKSMLIRDCMWNGEAANRTGSFEKLRSLTKTPPLVDCNLRVLTYVDPSEIWPFNFNAQVKAANQSLDCEVKVNGSECIDEDVEIDVVGLEGKSPERKEGIPDKETKPYIAIKTKKDASPPCVDERVDLPLTPSTSDDEYSCKLRSGVKRKQTGSVGTDKDNCVDAKMKVLSGDESDQDSELGRATHNVLERKRRNELKQRFQHLRDSIPEIAGNDRTPKVAILQKAFSYITSLKAEEKNLIEETRKQRDLNELLLKRVRELQNDNCI